MSKSISYVVGIDEVGRGPIAGPITFCALIVKSDFDILSLFKNRVLRDSKKLNDKNRREIRTKLNKLKLAGELDFVIVSKSAKEIDNKGLSKVINSCLEELVMKLLRLNYNLDKSVTHIKLDGGLKFKAEFIDKINTRFGFVLGAETIIKGDEKVGAIALASIMAKITRDNYMLHASNKIYDKEFKFYNWGANVGYGTREHYEYIKKFGLSDIHRKSFLKSLDLPKD